MEIVSIKKYDIGRMYCYGCNCELNLKYPIRVEFDNGKAVYLCNSCCGSLSKICGVEVEEVEKPDIDECNDCMLRFKCFTIREKSE